MAQRGIIRQWFKCANKSRCPSRISFARIIYIYNQFSRVTDTTAGAFHPEEAQKSCMKCWCAKLKVLGSSERHQAVVQVCKEIYINSFQASKHTPPGLIIIQYIASRGGTSCMKCWCAMLKVLGGSEERGIYQTVVQVCKDSRLVYSFFRPTHMNLIRASQLYTPARSLHPERWNKLHMMQVQTAEDGGWVRWTEHQIVFQVCKAACHVSAVS